MRFLLNFKIIYSWYNAEGRKLNLRQSFIKIKLKLKFFFFLYKAHF